jgi:hypothetical protein
MKQAADTEIGFVWLCFLRRWQPNYYHNLLQQKMLRCFVPAQIGFVFSNQVFNPQKIWGLSKIGFELALFFASKIRRKHQNIQ